MPELVGGSADLAPSTLTLIDGGGSSSPAPTAGRNLHFGIREHGMGAIVNGLVLHGFRAFGAGLPDLQRLHEGRRSGSPRSCASRRRSCSRTTRSALGEDGPTHQPIEQLATLRATPNIDVVRPAGFNETALAWRFALRQTETPTVLALSRQGLPMWDPAGVPDDAIERGAYVLHETRRRRPAADPHGAPAPRCTSRYDAATLLEADGVRVRLVSMPCLDRFAAQDAAYRDSVLPPPVRARVAVEAASPLGWHRWVGDAGRRRRDGGLRRVRAREGPLRALRLHRRGRGRARATSAEPTDMIDHRRPA